MANPGDGDLAVRKFGKGRLAMLPDAWRQERFPNHFVKKSPRVEMFGGSKIFERTGQSLSGLGWAEGQGFAHTYADSLYAIVCHAQNSILENPKTRAHFLPPSKLRFRVETPFVIR